MQKQVIYAGFNARLIANLIDLAFLSVLLVPLGKVVDYFFKKDFAIDPIQQLFLNAAEKFPKQTLSDSLMGGKAIVTDPKFQEIMIGNMFSPANIILNISMLALMAIFWYKYQTSLGKLLIGIKIVDAQTFGKISLWQSLVRSLSCILTVSSCMLGMIWMLFNDKRQAWHDIISGTIVVKR